MIGTNNTVLLALPEIIILITACLALLGNLFFKQVFHSIALVLAAIGLSMAAYVSFSFIGQYAQLGFHGLFISDDLAHMLKLFIYLTVFLSFFYSKYYLDERKLPGGDFYVLGLFSTLGMMILVSCYSFLTVYLGVELLSLPLYAMTAIWRKHSNGSEAAMKYFVLGALAVEKIIGLKGTRHTVNHFSFMELIFKCTIFADIAGQNEHITTRQFLVSKLQM